MTNDSSWRPTTPVMSSVERRDAALLIVESSLGLRSSLRQLLAALGFYNTSEASDPVTALKKIEERNFTHFA